jgi:hypothetical protein
MAIIRMPSFAQVLSEIFNSLLECSKFCQTCADDPSCLSCDREYLKRDVLPVTMMCECMNQYYEEPSS